LHKSLAEIGTLSVAEYADWVEFAKLEPFGPYYDDLRSGQIASMLGNVHRDVQKRPEPFQPSEFAGWNALHRRNAQPQRALENEDPNVQTTALMNAMGVPPSIR
jgi:hypothetical protein